MIAVLISPSSFLHFLLKLKSNGSKGRGDLDMPERTEILGALELESTGIITAETESAGSGPDSAQSRPSGILWLVLAALIWGTVGVASALLNRVETTPPLMIAFLRLGFAAPFLLALAWFTTRRNPFRITPREWAYFSAMGLAMACYQISYFFAIPLAGVTVVVVVALCSSPLMVALISIPVFKEKLTGPTLLALALAITGTVLLATGGNSGENARPQLVLGASLALITGLAYSTLVVFSKLATHQKETERGPVQPVAVAFSLAALILLVITLLTGSFKIDLAPGVWLIGAYMGLVPTGLAYVIFFKGIARASATAAAITTMLEPSVAALLAWLLLQEQLTLASLAGSALLLASVLVLSKK
jgi:DME family drug/metabolite transporter